MACVSAGTWFRSGTRSASLSVNNGFSFSTTRTRSSSVSSVNYTTASATPPLLLECSLFSSSLSPSSRSSFSGLSLEVDLNFNSERRKQAGHRLVVRAGKKFQLCQTKRNRSRKSLARTHGFRLRMRTPGGRAVLQRRRAKGRRVLCPKSNPSSGKRA